MAKSETDLQKDILALVFILVKGEARIIAHLKKQPEKKIFKQLIGDRKEFVSLLGKEIRQSTRQSGSKSPR
jgi:hypothetical protein